MQNIYDSFVNFCYAIFGKSEKIHKSDVDEETSLKEPTEHLEDGSLNSLESQISREDLQEKQSKLEEERFLLDQQIRFLNCPHLLKYRRFPFPYF